MIIIMYWFKYILVLQIIHTPSLCEIVKQLYHERWKEIYSAPEPVGEEALFGYSVSYQFSKTTGIKRLIVGAPKADKFGKVYSCEIKADSECNKMKLRHVNLDTVKGSDYWFGATVKAWDSHVVACAPRKVEYNDAGAEKQYGIFSSCYYNKDPSKHSLVEMPLTKNMINKSNEYYYGSNANLYEHTMTTFGWSMDAVDNTIFIGGPAMTTGRVIKYQLYDNTSIKPTKTILTFENGTVLFKFGYSIASGTFLEKDKRVHAISSPYGEMGKGKIIFFNENDIVVAKHTDDDVGTIFGSALCFVNLGSGEQHLLVGAPAFAPLKASASNDASASSDLKVPYDIGAVHVLSVNKPFYNVFVEKTIVGHQNGGYFGNAIVNLGDLNGDHVDEVAIAAPYEDEGQGAVYIYSGADLLKNEPIWTQRIKAESRPEARYRGLSLAVLQDNDENGCNELAIGVPGANHVMLVRCIASVNTSLELNLPPSITNRTLRNFIFKPCLHVTFPEKPTTVNSSIIVTIQIIHPNASIEAADNGTYQFQADLTKREEKYCAENVKVLLPKGGDYDQPLVFNMTAKLSVDPMEQKEFDPALVTLSESSQLWTRGEVMAPGSDLNVIISSTMQNGYLIGSNESEQVTLVVRNAESVAYDVCLRVRFDGGSATVMRLPKTCNTDDEGTILCVLLEPLHAGSNWTGIIELDTTTMTSNSEKVTIVAELFSRCGTSHPRRVRDQIIKTITLKSDPTLISVKGSSNTDLFMILTDNDLNSETSIEHVYSIMNRGYSTWENIKCDITVPSYVNTEVIVVDSSTTCDKINDGHIECSVKKVKGNNKVDINVVMTIPPNSPITAEISKNLNASVVTHINLRLGDKNLSEGLTTVLSLNESVPLWIIIVASVVAFLVLALLAFALYECGFLRRKNKDKLEGLKQEIKRQTIIRQSVNLRQSLINATAIRAAKLEERDRLLTSSEGNVTEDRRVVVEDDVGSFATKADVH